MSFYTQDLVNELKGQLSIAEFEVEQVKGALAHWKAQDPQEITEIFEDDIGETVSTAGDQVASYEGQALPQALSRVEMYKFLLSKFADNSITGTGVSSGSNYDVPRFRITL